MSKGSFAIVGAGAVGSYYGGRLVQGGEDVHFLARSDFEAMKNTGMVIQSCAGDFHLSPAQLNVYPRSEEMPKVDWVIVALKTTSNHLFDPLIRPLLHESTAILTIQNGLGNESRLAELFGVERILGGVAFACINRIAPGRIAHTAHGRIRLGEFHGGPSPRAHQIAKIFNHCKIPCDVLNDLNYGRWEKLIWNIPFNGLSAILDQTTDQLLSSPAGEDLIREIMEEVRECAQANGVDLPEGLIQENIHRTREMAAYQTSMHVDRKHRRELEVEAVLGEPWRRGSQRNVANPGMKMLYALAAMVNTQTQFDQRAMNAAAKRE